MPDAALPIVISACGWVTPYAAGSIHDVLTASRPEASSASACRSVADHLFEGVELSTEMQRDRGAQLAGLAFVHARQNSARQNGAIDFSAIDGSRVGLVLGYGLAGQPGMIGFAEEVREQTPRFVSPIHFPQTVGNYIAGALSRGFDIRGPNLTLASGTGSGLDAISEAARILQYHEADIMFAGGVETLTPALAPTETSGNAPLCEGACLFILQRLDDETSAVLAHLRDEEPSASLSPAIRSVTHIDEPGAISIASWIGHCGGALGSAAVAAAIGAAQGYPVPLQGDSKPYDSPAVTALISAENHNTPLIMDVPTRSQHRDR